MQTSNPDDSRDDRQADDEIERLAKLYADDFDELDEDEDSVSLEDLSRSYANVMQPAASEVGNATNQHDDEIQIFDPLEEENANEPHVPISPIAIVEAVLMVGRPDGGGISATEIAALMRGVTEAEVDLLVQQLNQQYAADNRALHIMLVGGAYRLQLADDLEFIREQFLGPAREVKLNQSAIDCLALVAYQPGITREQLDEQRGQPSGAVLNQLVRRELLEMRREKDGKKLEPHYYPTDRLLGLAGLESLEDLPTVEDWNG